MRVDGQQGSARPPDVAPFAVFLANRLGASRIISLGGAEAFHGLDIPARITVIGFDDPASLTQVPHPSGHWEPLPAGHPLALRVRWVDPGETVGIIFDLGDQPLHRDHLEDIVFLAHQAQVTIVAVAVDRRDHMAGALAARHVVPVFVGSTRDLDSPNSSRDTGLLLFERPHAPLSPAGLTAPDDFEVMAFVITYNEEDIIGPSLEDLSSQGVSAYVIDNWSTDATYEIAHRYLGSGVIGIERSPADRAPEFFDLRSILLRLEALTRVLEADWFLRHDADEVRRSPWPEVTVREALYRVQSAGYNCVDFTVVNFPPTDDEFVPGTSFLHHFQHFEFGANRAHFRQFKAWLNFGQQIEYARTGGHEVKFPGRRVFPYKFLVRHYPIRSQAHGERKVFRERKDRFLPEAREHGWHHQYDALSLGHRFVRASDFLTQFAEESFGQDYLIERLSGVGLPRRMLQDSSGGRRPNRLSSGPHLRGTLSTPVDTGDHREPEDDDGDDAQVCIPGGDQ